MLPHGPGAPVATTVLRGGTATLHERALLLAVRGTTAAVELSFPMIGRPGVVTPSARLGTLQLVAGARPVADVERDVRAGLDGHLALRATGTAGPLQPVALGPLVGTTIGMHADLAHRTLYDVVARDDAGQWRVIAPHAFYARTDWHDFGIAHITDTHVARRIDGFRDLLVSLRRHDAAAAMRNWNDRFRGFIRYANHLHAEGVLDVVVATGDLCDYLFERGDDRLGGGNAEFFHELLRGRAPGPHFPDVEELRVPIFTVPGNHDHRANPYELVFDVDLGIGGARRVTNYSGYDIGCADAVAVGVRRNGADVPGEPVERAARMLDVQRVNEPYRRWVADAGSYVVELDSHRLAMLDSAWDIGVVSSMADGLRTFFGPPSDAGHTFVGGSAECEGVSAADVAMTAAALEATPDGGLFIVGIHAAPFGSQLTRAPYFLRQTQRAHHHEQVVGHLSHHTDPATSSETTAGHRQRVAASHRSWFPMSGDRRPPSFVARIGTGGALAQGASPRPADELLGVLAGLGRRRAADVVLAGHSHHHGELTLRPSEHGELEVRTDFYTQNPVATYPTRFLDGWSTGPFGGQVAHTDVTAVEVSPAAPPWADPWPMPGPAATHRNIVQVPPYAEPLAAAAEPSSWWAAHRPLILQTAAVGPQEDSDVSFGGFRLLSVRDDVIQRIHHVPLDRLHAAGYRMAWVDAVAPDAPRRHLHIHRFGSRDHPQAVGSPASHAGAWPERRGVLHRDGNGAIHELARIGVGSMEALDLTAAAGAPAAYGDPTSWVDGGRPVTAYRGRDGHVHTLHRTADGIGHHDLTASCGAPHATGEPVGFVDGRGTSHVVHTAGAGHIWAMWWLGGSGAAVSWDVTKAARAEPAIGRPAAYVTPGDRKVVVHRATDGHIRSLSWSDGVVDADDLSGAAGAPPAAGDPSAHHTVADDTHRVAYRTADGHVWELCRVGSSPVTARDLTAESGAPPAASDPVGYRCTTTGTEHVVFRTADGHIRELWWRPGAGAPVHVDLTVESLAPPATDRPVAWAVPGVGSQHVVYRGADRQLHEITWTDDGGCHTTASPSAGVSESTLT
jgi:hypothetical protein